MISNKMEISDKGNNRTHHTRFFEKLYGNLEKSSDEKQGEKLLSSQVEIGMQEKSLNSPSESSGSSSAEMYPSEISVSRWCKATQKSFN